MTEKMSVFMLTIFSLIFTIAASLGVMNTLLMSTYDRMKEFGIIQSNWSNALANYKTGILTEAILLTGLASIIGIIVGLGIAFIFAGIWN